MLTSCATQRLQQSSPAVHGAQQQKRLDEARTQLDALVAVDMRVQLDNVHLAPALRTLVREALAAIPGWSGDEVNIDFLPGYITLDIKGTYTLSSGETIHVTLAGDLQPEYLPDQLGWLVNLHQLETTDKRFDGLAVATGSGTTRLDTDTLLATLGRDLQDAVSRGQDNRFAFSSLPLGILETGIRLRAPVDMVRAESSALAGVPTTVGSAVLIEPATTQLALDLNFVPALPDCQASVSVGRATFAREVTNREPVAAVAGRARGGDAAIFFTDILDSRAPTTIIHYWFADGEPASIAELPVEQSARWRTWSSAPDEISGVNRWQVLVIEKGSGCILANRSIRLAPPAELTASGQAGDSGTAGDAGFTAFADAFNARTAMLGERRGFSGVARVDVDRRFFAAALSAAMYDLRLTSSPRIEESSPRPIEARIGAVRTDTMSCEQESCDSARVCALDYDKCPVRRDTRDCRSCLMRNPLNNRCISEAEDPICLTARDSENARLEANREACIARETRLRDSCVLLREQELSRCQQRASRELNSCSAQVTALADRYRTLSPLAAVRGETRLAGSMSFEFSEFRIDENLERVRMVFAVEADLVAEATLAVVPEPDLGVLEPCLPASSNDYRARLSLPPWQGGLVSNLTVDRSYLSANWSGLIQRLEANPSPVTRFLDSGAGLMAGCEARLTSKLLAQSLSGPGTDLLRGIIDIDMQPEPTRISLLPAYLGWADEIWIGDALIGERTVSYLIDRAEGATERSASGVKP